MTGAGILLRTLARLGVDHLFANAGSDFAPILEAYAAEPSAPLPRPVPAPHEAICVGMAHGFWLATGRAQAVAVHVNVGLANAVIGLLNARSDDIPMLVMSGRTPLTEGDRPGARRTPIQAGQEMFDQAALAREATLWQHELRYPEQAAELAARALAVARAAPGGPVYLALPREPLCEAAPWSEPAVAVPAPPHPDPAAVAAAAEVLARAERPLVIASRGDPSGRVAGALAALAEHAALPVAEVFVTRNLLASGHPCAVGGDLRRTLPRADAVLVVDTPVAWVASVAAPHPEAAVIHLGPDPLFTRLPTRGYRATAAIACAPEAGLEALRAALPPADEGRRQALASRSAAQREAVSEAARAGATGVPTKPWVAACVSAILGPRGVVFSERGGPCSSFTLAGPNRWFGNTQAGGLGWSLPAAMGFQLADRERLVVCVTGDGSYLFANPPACHQVMAAERLPVLTVILDNAGYEAVRQSAREVYPGGATTRANRLPMVGFEPALDHAAIAAAAGLWARQVSRAEDLPAALAEAARAVREDRRPAVVQVRLAPA